MAGCTTQWRRASFRRRSTESPKAPSKDCEVINGGDDDEMDVLHKRRCCRSQTLDVENITQMASLHRGGKERLGGEGSFAIKRRRSVPVRFLSGEG